MKHCLIFSREIIIYFRIVLCLNIPWLKAINEITADYTTRQLRISYMRTDKTRLKQGYWKLISQNGENEFL